MTKQREVRKEGKTVEEGVRITKAGSDLVETALRRMGFNPDDKNMPQPDFNELAKAMNAELAKKELRK